MKPNPTSSELQKGVEHKLVAHSEFKIMLVKPKGVVNTGAAESDLTAEADVWV